MTPAPTLNALRAHRALRTGLAGALVLLAAAARLPRGVVIGPAQDLEAALGPASPTGQNPVGGDQGRGASVEALTAVGGRGDPAGDVGALVGHGGSSVRGRRRS